VFNFPNEFAGPPSKISLSTALPTSAAASALTIGTIAGTGAGIIIIGPQGNAQGSITVGPLAAAAAAASAGAIIPPQSAYGIWNGASIMSLSFVQRHDQYDLVGRWQLGQTDCSRWYTTFGARHVWFWERFLWRTVSLSTDFPSPTASGSVTFNAGNVTTTTSTGPSFTVTSTAGVGPITVAGLSGADDVAIYTNIVSNRMWGPTFSCGSEWYLGWGFSCSLDLKASVLLDVVKERAKYQREDRYIQNKRAKTEYTFVPELSAAGYMWWYPIEGVEMRFGYEVQNYWNTIASPQPVDFNYGALLPPWDKNRYRFLEGFNAGIAFIF
jgi:hypothetical protein